MLNVNIICSKYMKIICFEYELGPTIIVIIKTSSTGPSGKSKVAYKLLSQPHKHLRHGKLKKTQPI